jgi:MIF4G domain
MNPSLVTLSSFPVYIPAAATPTSSSANTVSSGVPEIEVTKKDENVSESNSNTALSRQVPVVQEINKSKKSLWKDKIAAADANASRGDNMLDAYTTSTVPDVIKPHIPLVPEEVVREVIIAQPEPEEDWEVTADKIASGEKVLTFSETISPVLEKEVIPVKTSRSLRPQGNSKLNAGPVNRPLPVRLTYSRDFILKQRSVMFSSDTPPECPTVLEIYNNIITENNSAVTSTAVANTSTSKPRGTGSISRNTSNDFTSIIRSTESESLPDSGAWKRDGGPPSNTNTSGQSSRSSNPSQSTRQPPRDRAPLPVGFVPPPKKVVTDPLEIFTLQIRAILNKITPQTFEKLAGQIKEQKISSSLSCDRLVSLIFEKAIFEQNFSNLYADLCLDLEKQLSTNYIHVIYFRDSNQYSWVIDIDVENNLLAGPYKSTKDCVNASANDTLPPTRLIPYKLALHELIVSNHVLIKIFKNMSHSNEEYFCGFSAVSDIPSQSMSSVRFASRDDAKKHALKKNTIKNRLLKLCADEFYQSSDKVSE